MTTEAERLGEEVKHLSRAIEINLVREDMPQCADHDGECWDIPDKVACWLHAPEEGLCPYLEGKKP